MSPPTSSSQYLLLGILAIAAVMDIQTRKVSNYLIGLGVGVAIFLCLLPGSDLSLVQCLLGGGLGFLIFYYPFVKECLGAADTKLFVTVGMFLGPNLAFWAFVFSCLIGGVIALLVALYQKELKQSLINVYQQNRSQMNFPYAVAIFLGTGMAILKLQNYLI
jgi:prepilin peptidase CpaA